jgi:DNA-binding CsgD family transcriptional regulator
MVEVHRGPGRAPEASQAWQGDAPRIVVPRHVLFEREVELDVVERLARAAAEGRGSSVTVRGPLGNGKSALLAAMALVAERHGMTVLRASGAWLERDFPHGVSRQLVDPVLHGAPPNLSARDGSRFSADAELFAGQRILTGHDISQAGTMILVDDVQWADAPSLRWLAHLTERLDRVPALLVCSVRDGDPWSDGAPVRRVIESAGSTLSPRPLSLDGVDALIKEQTGRDGAEEFVLACVEATGGNPMFLMSLLVCLSTEDKEPTADNVDRVHAARPVQLRDRLWSCLRHQLEPVRIFAKAMTILGANADVDLVERLTGLDAMSSASALRTLHRLGFLVDRGVPRFALDIVRDAVEESMSIEERERGHVEAVALLHRSGRPTEEVATQLLAISSTHLPWAAETLREAAEAALRRGAPDDALRYLRRILLDTSPTGIDRAAVHVELAMASRTWDLAESVRHMSTATSLFHTTRDRAAALVRFSPTALVEAPTAVRGIVCSIVADLGDPTDLAGVDRDLALRVEARRCFLARSEPAALVDSARRLRERDADADLTTPAQRELHTVLLHAATTVVGATAARVAERAELVLSREPATPEHIHGVVPLLVEALCAADSPDVLVPWLDMAAAQATAMGADASQGVIRLEQAVVALHRGQLSDAAAAAHTLLGTGILDWRRGGTAAFVPLTSVALGTRDDVLIGALLTDPPARDDDRVQVGVALGILHGLTASAGGDLHSALAYTMDAGAQLERAGWRNPVLFPWRTIAAVLRNRLGDTEGARALAEEELVRATDWGAPSAIGRAGAVLGELTEGDPGLVLLREAVEVLGKSANHAELALALLRLGRRLWDTDRRAAGETLRLAHSVAVECGDTRTAARALRTVGGDGKVRALTRAEDRVVALAVAGRKNTEIAQELGVSVRAVEKHLTKAYQKLRVNSRSELAQGLLNAREVLLD